MSFCGGEHRPRNFNQGIGKDRIYLKKLINFIFVCVLMFVFISHAINILLPVKYEDIITKYADEYSVPKTLLMGVIKTESNFKKDAVSKKDAKGLMQITDETALWCAEKMGIENFDTKELFGPDTNIKIGGWYLKYLIDKTESEDIGIISYNAGINRVNEWLGSGVIDKDLEKTENIPYPETKNYIKKVRLYEKLYGYITKYSK